MNNDPLSARETEGRGADALPQAVGRSPLGIWLRLMAWPLAVVSLATMVVAAVLLRAGATIADADATLFWQLIDLRDLRDAPLDSLWNLHTQPPLYNLAVVLIDTAPGPFGPAMFIVQMVCLWLTGLFVADLLRRWGVSPLIAGVAATVGCCSPTLLSAVSLAGYEVPVAMLIAASLWSVQRYLEAPDTRRLIVLSTVLTVAALTRSMLTPLWVLAILALVVVVRRIDRRGVALAIAIPVVLLGGLTVKNAIVFDVANTSSWFGFNLHRGVTSLMPIDTVQSAVESGDVSDDTLVAPYSPLESYGVVPSDNHNCGAPNDSAALTRVAKQQVGLIESSNFNHYCYLELYSEAQSDAVELGVANPGRYLADRRHGALLSLSTVEIGVETQLLG